MDCSQSEIFMMQHFEKTIKPKNANALARHVLSCESCRELYLAFDEGFDISAGELTEAPSGFTESVMGKVREFPDYKKAVTGSISVALRVLWGLSAIVTGIVLLFIFNPHWIGILGETFPAADTVIDAIAGFGAIISTIFTGTYQNGGVYDSVRDSGIAALLFVTLAGTLLFVLHNGEKSVKT